MIRVGIIGAGFMGRNHFNQYEQMTDRCKVVALCDPEADRRAGDWSSVGGNVGDAQGTQRDLGDIKPLSDWKDLLNDPDVDMVDICVPTPFHAQMSIEFLKAGKHVLCEKPMALTVEDCDKMLQAATDAKGKFMVAQVVRFWPEYTYIKKIVADKSYGELKALHLRRQAATPDYSLNDWIKNEDWSGGAILDLHVHDVDFAMHLLGKPQALFAQGTTGPNGINRVHASWQYDSGVVCQIEGFWDMPSAFGFNMGISTVFEQAAIHWDINTGKPLTVLTPDGESHEPKMPEKDGYYTEIEYFLNCIEQNKNPKWSTPTESRDAVSLALAEAHSVKTGQIVQVR